VPGRAAYVGIVPRRYGFGEKIFDSRAICLVIPGFDADGAPALHSLDLTLA